MTEIFGYGIAHKVTGERLHGTGRKAYDGKAAASAGMKKVCEAYSWAVVNRNTDLEYMRRVFKGQNPYEFEVVELGVYAPAS